MGGIVRGDKPSTRARLALNRLSRERWISGKECRDIVRGWVGNIIREEN